MYAFRKIRDTFKKNKSLADPLAIEKEMANGLKNFDIIKRQVSIFKRSHKQNDNIIFFQVLVGNLYSADKLVIEK